MRIQKRKDTASTNRIKYAYAIGTAVLVGLLHKAGWVGPLYKKPVASQAHYIPRTHGRAYYRTDRYRKNGRDKAKHVRSLPGCEALCSSVEQWFIDTTNRSCSSRAKPARSRSIRLEAAESSEPSPRLMGLSGASDQRTAWRRPFDGRLAAEAPR